LQLIHQLHARSQNLKVGPERSACCVPLSPCDSCWEIRW
jgi:hypothetical protein